MTERALREELQGQSGDHPDVAQLHTKLLRPKLTRIRQLAVAGIAAAVVALIVVGAITLRDALAPTAEPVASAAAAQSPGIAATSAPRSPLRTWTLDCRDPVDLTAEAAKDLTPVLGVVALNTSAQQIGNRTPDPGATVPAERFFAKSMVQIRVGRPFRMQVADSQRGLARIGWSNVAVQPGDVMQVPACGEAGNPTTGLYTGAPTAQWLTYPGGIWVAEPMCVELVIDISSPATSNSTTSRTGSTAPYRSELTLTSTVHIPVGAPCT